MDGIFDPFLAALDNLDKALAGLAAALEEHKAAIGASLDALNPTRLANHPDTPSVGGWNCNDYDWRHQLGPNWEDRWERNRG